MVVVVVVTPVLLAPSSDPFVRCVQISMNFKGCKSVGPETFEYAECILLPLINTVYDLQREILNTTICKVYSQWRGPLGNLSSVTIVPKTHGLCRHPGVLDTTNAVSIVSLCQALVTWFSTCN